jgi:multiple sugar transport system ATP-binding protein
MKTKSETSNAKPLLRVEAVSFNYAGQNSFRGIQSISFQVQNGQFVSVLGKSGSGKTTLLKCIFGIEDVSEGKISYAGEQVFGPSRQLLPGRPGMSLVSQDFYVLENHTVGENISDKLSGYSDGYKSKRVAELLRVLQLIPFETKKAKELSSGQRQRLSIARALADFPKLLLLDEPFSNLDAGLKDLLLNYIRKEAAKHNSAVLMVTHHAEDTLKFSDEILILKDGKLVQRGNPEQVYFFPKSLDTARLFGKAFRVKNFPGNLKILRPEYLEESTANESLLKIQIQDNNFCGGCFEISGRDNEKNQVSFYSNEPISNERREIFLKLRKGLLRKS